MAHEALLSLALLSSRAERPSNRRQRWTLGEDLGVGADGDLEILRPQTVLDQGLLQALGALRARIDAAQVAAHALGQLLADLQGGGGVAPGALLDHPLQGRDGEGDAGGLQALQIDGGQQLGGRFAMGVSPHGTHVQDFQRALVLAARQGHAGTIGVHQVGDRRGDLRHVLDASAAHQHGGRAVTEVDAAQKGRVLPIIRKELRYAHGVVSPSQASGPRPTLGGRARSCPRTC
jgi:hypothetical protein